MLLSQFILKSQDKSSQKSEWWLTQRQWEWRGCGYLGVHFINILWLSLHTYALSVWSILNKNYIRIALQLMTQNFIALFLSHVKNAWNVILKENTWLTETKF